MEEKFAAKSILPCKETKLSDSINVLSQMITLYTNEQDNYERHSATLILSTIAIFGTLLGGIIALFAVKGVDFVELSKVIAFVLLLFPVMATLFLYIFALNTRKVVVYRGYLNYLEQCLNQRLKSMEQIECKHESHDLLKMNCRLWDAFISGKDYKFHSGKIEELATAIFGVLFYVGAFSASVYFYVLSRNNVTDAYKWVYGITFIVILILCALSALFCGIDIFKNSDVRSNVGRYCINGSPR